MKKFTNIMFLLIVPILLSSCSIEEDKHKIEGAYLGQLPPGEIPELFAPDILSTGSHELDITIAPDGNEIFFTRTGPDWFSAILQYKLVDGVWTGPLMPQSSGGHQTSYPFVSPTGDKLFFNSQAPWANLDPNKRRNAVFVSELTGSGWSEGKVIESIIVDQTESYVSVAANGNTYFGARYEDGYGGCDLYKCEFNGGSYSGAVNLGEEINSEHHEFHLFIAPDESYILFDARRPDGYGANDLFVSFKKSDDTWGQAQNLGDKINTEYSESRPYISPDGKYLFFCSNRLKVEDESSVGTQTYDAFQNRIAGPGNGNQDIYWIKANFINELNEQN